ncbi:MliC family protein [Pelovirga terrestris]|uniref:MliC family protein n=1 Tax=Pelovirga terrestris TaxID=2771352 RepID=A0A8J6QM49_9BACT|nr:MliC family protein [Pelovirga terrestris]MBD1401104.1 MliC family protein [Pelovirga terrestris]
MMKWTFNLRWFLLLLVAVVTLFAGGCSTPRTTTETPPQAVTPEPAITEPVVDATAAEVTKQDPPPPPPQIPLDPEQTINYRCSNGVIFQVQADEDRARLVAGGHEIVLPRVPSASGVKYQEGRNLYWNKGETAEVEVIGKRFSDCAIAWTHSRREEARNRGIWVWASGNEPDWIIEIGDTTFVLITDLGQNRQEFRTPIPVRVAGSGSIRYQISNRHEIDLVLTEKLCRDSMSGEYFFAEATLTLDGVTMPGCGDFLYR